MGVRTKGGLRHRVGSVILLGVITSAVSLFGLVRILSVTATQRIERAREAVAGEIDRMATRTAIPRDDRPRFGLIGVHGGFVPRADATVADAPDAWRGPVDSVLHSSATSGARVMATTKIGEGTLVVGAQPAQAGSVAWAGYLVEAPPWLRVWQAIIIVLAAATTLLVATAIYAMTTIKRGAAAINASLVALATDLEAPIPRPPVRELGEIADGIADLADKLAVAREVQQRLGRELSDKERLATLGRVVAGVAHEVRNPLASIKLRLDLAAATADVPEPLARAIAHASSEIARLDRLVADLLVVSGRSIGARTPSSLGDLVRARVDALAPWATTKQITIAIHGDAEVPVDADSLGRALDNVVRNAVEASPSDAIVDVRVSSTTRGARVAVEDRGEGVTPEREAELFEPFFTTKPEGTGLGLALSRAIARAHGGDVSYARVGSITRFEIAIDDPRAPRRSELTL